MPAQPVVPKVEPPKAEPVPKRPEPKPVAKPRARPKPRAAAPRPTVAPEPRPVQEVRAGSIAGAVDGAAAGVAGGVVGGQVGGVVAGRGSGPVPAGQVAQQPAVLSRVSPEYPRASRLAGVQGLVLLEAILDEQGRVDPDIKVLRSVPELDRAAVEALRRWRFKPARDERGQAVAVILEVPIRFKLR
jgi:protein TonB